MTKFEGNHPSLMRRVLVTLGALALYRFGGMIPLPGVDAGALDSHSILARTIERLSIFALGVIPIFSAMLLGEIARLAIPPLERWAEARVASYKRAILILSLALAVFQSVGIAIGLEGVTGVVAAPGMAFRVIVVVSLVGATAFLAWLGEAIARYGIGGGFWVLFIAPSIADAANLAPTIVDALKNNSLPMADFFVAFGFSGLAIVLLVIAQGAADGAAAKGRDVFADVWPAIIGGYASWMIVEYWSLFVTPGGIANSDPDWSTAGPIHLSLMAAMIALVAAMRAKDRPIWPLALAQIFACVGGVVLTRWLILPVAVDGVWLVLVVAMARSGRVTIALSKER